jgi:7,8-dihydro-6-hydroxymethylpterin-pyrophosphokinase
MRAEPVIAYIGLGANLGAAEQAVTQALLGARCLAGHTIGATVQPLPFSAARGDRARIHQCGRSGADASVTYGDGRIESPHLTVPHPRITERAFVLLPWAEIAPDRVRPEHLARLSDQEITKIQGI